MVHHYKFIAFYGKADHAAHLEPYRFFIGQHGLIYPGLRQLNIV